MKRFAIFILLIHSFNLYSQKGLRHCSPTSYVSLDDSSSVLISESLITNRDYLIYLMWLSNVYVDYPNVLRQAVPGINVLLDCPELDDNQTFINCIKENAEPYTKDYLFSPRYLDYPVLGLSWEQASRFTNWIGNRYNEYKLIKMGQFKFSDKQRNENCFVTESYVNKQYISPDSDDTAISWSEKVLLPSFRLPTTKELNKLNQGDSSLFSLDKQKTKRQFLKPWEKLYLKEKGGEVLLSDFNKSLSNDKILHLTSSLKPLCIEKLRVREMTLDLDSNLSVVEAYSKQGYFIEPKENYFDEYGSMGEKDSTGRMGYIIIDETKDGKPILLDNRNVSNGKEKPNYLSVFRFAVTMRPKQYK